MPRRTPPPPRGPQLELAGELSVAFVNTAGARPENRQQGVESFDDFVTWCRDAGTVSAHRAERLRRRAAERPAEAQAAFAWLATLRAALARIFLAIERQEPADEADLDAFNQALAESSLAPRLVATETGAAWTWAGDPDALDSLLSPVLHSAHEVITTARGRPHVRRCAAEGCPLFFVDRSASRRRKWCSMTGCGHRTRNQRYYRRVLKAERQRMKKNAIRRRHAGAREQEPARDPPD